MNAHQQSGHPKATAPVNLLHLTLIFSALSAFAPLATDMYLASFPQLAQSLHTDIGKVALGLSIYFLGLSVGQTGLRPVDRSIRQKRTALARYSSLCPQLGIDRRCRLD